MVQVIIIQDQNNQHVFILLFLVSPLAAVQLLKKNNSNH